MRSSKFKVSQASSLTRLKRKKQIPKTCGQAFLSESKKGADRQKNTSTMKKIILFVSSIICTITLNAQNLNVELFDQYVRADARYSGSWTYVGPDGSEYALLGAFSGLAAYSIDNAPVTEVGFIAGPESNWREITVVDNHAYVTTEGSAHSFIEDHPVH